MHLSEKMSQNTPTFQTAKAEKPSSPEGGAMVEEPPKAKAPAPLRRKDPPSFNFPGTVLLIEKSDFTHEGYDHAFLKPQDHPTGV